VSAPARLHGTGRGCSRPPRSLQRSETRGSRTWDAPQSECQALSHPDSTRGMSKQLVVESCWSQPRQDCGAMLASLPAIPACPSSSDSSCSRGSKSWRSHLGELARQSLRLRGASSNVSARSSDFYQPEKMLPRVAPFPAPARAASCVCRAGNDPKPAWHTGKSLVSPSLCHSWVSCKGAVGGGEAMSPPRGAALGATNSSPPFLSHVGVWLASAAQDHPYFMSCARSPPGG